jgi:multimeric flavodoxin WrbA
LKILGIACSPRKNGNTEILVKEALSEAVLAGCDTDLFLAADKQIAFCDACGGCRKEGVCRIHDDMEELYQKLLWADGIIFGSPVYFHNVSAQAKAIMDRTFSLLRRQALKDKVAGAVVVARRIGASQTRDMLFGFFIAQKMIVAGGAIGYGREKGDVLEGVGGGINASALEEAREIGRDVVRLASRLEKGKRQADKC